MKKLFLFITVFMVIIELQAQNVGIGTNDPRKKLSVNGSVLIDQGGNNTGSLDSASLVFGHLVKVGISSNKLSGASKDGMDFWTNGFKRISINQSGNVGIGIDPENAFKLQVGGTLHATDNLGTGGDLYAIGVAAIGTAPNPLYKLLVNGSSRIQGSETVTGNITGNANLTIGGTASISNALVAGSLQSNTTIRANERLSIGGSVDNDFRLRVYDGDSRFGGNVEATGNMTIGCALDNNWKLRVIGGNSRFGGDAQITGNLDVGSADVSGALTIGGKGSIRSNGPSALRIGFDSKTINNTFSPGEVAFLTANLSTAISGDNDDFRVMISQYRNGAGGDDALQFFGISITNINAAANTCDIRLKNLTSSTITLVGTIYLTTIAKN